LPGQRVGLQHEHRLGGNRGHDQPVGVLVVGQGADPVAVEAQRSETRRADMEREPEDR
jgi:hypothetical protein